MIIAICYFKSSTKVQNPRLCHKESDSTLNYSPRIAQCILIFVRVWAWPRRQARYTLATQQYLARLVLFVIGFSALLETYIAREGLQKTTSDTWIECACRLKPKRPYAVRTYARITRWGGAWKMAYRTYGEKRVIADIF